MAKIPSSVTQEIGYVNPFVNPSQKFTDWMMWDLLEDVPDLTYPLSLNVFHKMPRDDARVWSVLGAVRLPIRRAKYYIEPNGASDAVVEHVASDLNLPIKGDNDAEAKQAAQAKAAKTMPRQRDRFSWKNHLRSALSCLQYGHSVFEQVYRIGDDGKAHLAKLAPRPQRTISKWHVARDGGLVAIEQQPPNGFVMTTGIAGVLIDVSRLVVYRNEPDEGVWIGTSLLRPAYKHWILKNELIRLEAVAVRRNGVGVPAVTAPPGTNPDPNSPEMQAWLDVAKRFRGGNTAGVALPPGAIMQLLGVMGQRVDPRPAIDYHDKQIGVVALQQFLNLDKGGSYALADVQHDPYIQAVQAVLDDLLDVANKHVIEDLVDLNYSIDESAPLLVADDIGSQQDAQAAALNLLVQAELLKPDPAMRAFIRQHLGAPPEDPDEAADDDADDLLPPGWQAPAIPQIQQQPPAPVQEPPKAARSHKQPRPAAAAPEQGALWEE